jgi:hypothetical protein
MNKERIILQDRVIDISGPYIFYRDKEPGEEKLNPLPYTAADFADAGHPDWFFSFLQDTFTDKKTIETALYFLSLIISKSNEFGYSGFFIGPPRTGKTTLINILNYVLPGYFIMVSPQCHEGNYGVYFSPRDLQRLNGPGAAVIEEVSVVYVDSLNAVAKGKDITTQLIGISNYFPLFRGEIESLGKRLVAIPFFYPKRKKDPKTKFPQEIMEEIHNERAAILKLLVDTYLILKNSLRGIIPQSKDCRRLKRTLIFHSNIKGEAQKIDENIPFEGWDWEVD